jgi:hypothetical protein
MSVSSQTSPGSQSSNRPFFVDSFVRKAHTVVKLAYDRLDAPKLSTYEEEEITGELTREMQAALEDGNAPRWCRNFWAYEELRVSDDDRFSKDRKRIDIEVIKHQSGKRPKLRFEAKRLTRKHTVGTYLGKTGLGCFLDGSYASEDSIVGMLGYIQDRDVATYSAAIEADLNKSRAKYAFDATENWRVEKIIKGLDTFRSRHQRQKRLPPVDVIHTLLVFC